ncbi:MAG: tetratricopeptide repeat protein, partial [Rhodothermales bacterium]|nr:tetratricopeptide repeat protein [Rhodothermales bacterium]
GVAVLTALLLIPPVRQALFGGGVSIPDHRFLAVLPFDNVGNVAENQAFIDGLVYTVTSTLTEMEQFQDALSVVPARDVLEAGRLSTRAAAERFGVNLVLAGSVQRSERGVRIHLQLVDPARERVLASRQLDEPALDIAALQDDVVFELADLLEVEMNPAAERALTAGRTAVPVAFDFYTQALGYLQRFEDETNLDAAISLFGLAIKEDSSYALAYAGLGEAYLHRYQASNAAGDVEAALRNGERAVALGDDLAPVHVALGRIYFETGRYDRAELEYLRALVLEPKNAAAHHALGAVYARLGKDDDAEASYQQAIALKPDYWLYHNDLGQFYHRLGRHREALPKFKDVIALQPGNPWGYNNVGAQYARLGRTEEAITWYQKAATINPHAQRATAFANYNLGGIYYGRDDFAEAARRFEQVVAYFGTDRDAWENLGDAYHWGGDPAAARAPWQRAVALARERLAVNQADPGALGALAEDYARLGEADSARAAIERLLALDEPSTASLVSVAKAYEILGRRDDALTYLAAALDRGYAPVILDASAWLDALRQDPRYQQLVRTGRTAETD